MTARLIEFNMPSGENEKKPKEKPEKKNQAIPIGLARIESMGDDETNAIIAKVEAFGKLHLRVNKEIYERYLAELETYPLDQIVEISLHMQIEDMGSNPSYTRALFEVFSRKIKEVK